MYAGANSAREAVAEPKPKAKAKHKLKDKEKSKKKKKRNRDRSRLEVSPSAPCSMHFRSLSRTKTGDSTRRCARAGRCEKEQQEEQITEFTKQDPRDQLTCPSDGPKGAK